MRGDELDADDSARVPLAAGRLLALRRFGLDAVSFQAAHSGVRWWHHAEGNDLDAPAVPYVVAGRTWIAIGTPLAPPDGQPAAIRRFSAEARRHGCRAAFFGVEALEPFGVMYRHLLLGTQPELWSSQWPTTLAGRAKLREQLRRARAKGVRVRLVAAAELRRSTALRTAVIRLREEWLASRAMAPMGFLVQASPFYALDEHLYLVAEQEGAIVHFLSAVPIASRHGWLIEDVFRTHRAPNGTTELALDLLMRQLRDRSEWATAGLTPLAGRVPRWLKAAGAVIRPLYDFAGLQRFRERLAPTRWAPVWLVWDRGPALPVFHDILTAFARGSLLRFAIRSLVGRPNGLPWLVGLPLVPWSACLAAFAAARRAPLLGFSVPVLWGWVAFDAVLAYLLLRAARRPRVAVLTALAVLTLSDAAVSCYHFSRIGGGGTLLSETLRLIATAGPITGAAALAWAATCAHRQHRCRPI